MLSFIICITMLNNSNLSKSNSITITIDFQGFKLNVKVGWVLGKINVVFHVFFTGFPPLTLIRKFCIGFLEKGRCMPCHGRLPCTARILRGWL